MTRPYEWDFFGTHRCLNYLLYISLLHSPDCSEAWNSAWNTTCTNEFRQRTEEILKVLRSWLRIRWLFAEFAWRIMGLLPLTVAQSLCWDYSNLLLFSSRFLSILVLRKYSCFRYHCDALNFIHTWRMFAQFYFLIVVCQHLAHAFNSFLQIFKIVEHIERTFIIRWDETLVLVFLISTFLLPT